MDSCKFHPVAPSPRCRICNSLGIPLPPPKVSQLELKKPEKRHGLMPTWGDKNTWNLSALMRKNVLSSSYFNQLYQLRELSDILPEVEKHVKSSEPWIPGTCHTPTTLFCCLIKLFMMKLTEGQVRFLCDNSNPYLKVLGFLYIRFLSDPQELWDRLSNYTLSTQVFESTPGTPTTIGQYVEKLLLEQDYYGLQLPRIPITIQTMINEKCLQLPLKRQRFEKNLTKEFVKDSEIVVYVDGVETGVFKHREGNKAHVQVAGKDLHVSLGDIDDQYCSRIVGEARSSSVLAESRREYMKAPQSYKNALMFQVAQKRPRSPSSEKEEKIPQPVQSRKVEVHSLDEPYKRKCNDSQGPEYLKLG